MQSGDFAKRLFFVKDLCVSKVKKRFVKKIKI